MNPLLVIGCGGHARSVIDVVEAGREWQIVGMVGLPHQVGSTILGYPVIATDADLYSLRRLYSTAVLAIGQLPSPTLRQRLASLLSDLGFHSPTLVSPHSVVSPHAQLGAGTVVCHGAIVNVAAVVGAHCILNSRSLIEHDVQIGDHCHISTGALLNGGVRVGHGSFIGSGALIREGLHLPDYTVVRAGNCIMGWPPRLS